MIKQKNNCKSCSLQEDSYGIIDKQLLQFFIQNRMSYILLFTIIIEVLNVFKTTQ